MATATKDHPTNCKPSDVLNICQDCAKREIHTVYRIFAECEVCHQSKSVMQFIVNPSYLNFDGKAAIFVYNNITLPAFRR